MKSKVYFVGVGNSDTSETICDKFRALISQSRVLDFIQKDQEVAIKIHFGEDGNTGYVKPQYVRIIVDEILKKQAKCFLADTNTLYRGKRTNSADHIKLAYEHGFTKAGCGSEVIIPDDTKKENVAEKIINQKFIKRAKIARIFSDAHSLVGIAHFKGHIMTGFGGALKNIGMGCASREGKLAQHSDISPLVYVNKCIGCGECIKACPAGAIFMKDNLAYIDPSKCIGCATCIAACLQGAIEVNWEAGGSNIQQKLIEYAWAVLKEKKGEIAFINFAIKITKECDCLAKDDPRIVDDVGIFASVDPVSVDKASRDLVNKKAGKDIFKEAHPDQNSMTQLKYAEELGLGNTDYELIEL